MYMRERAERKTVKLPDAQLDELVGVEQDLSGRSSMRPVPNHAERVKRSIEARIARKERGAKDMPLRELAQTVVSGELRLLYKEIEELTRQLEHAENEYREHLEIEQRVPKNTKPSHAWSVEIDRLQQKHHDRYQVVRILKQGLEALQKGHIPSAHFFQVITHRLEGARHWEESIKPHEEDLPPIYDMAESRRIFLEVFQERVGGRMANPFQAEAG